LRRYFFTTERIAGTTANPTPVLNTTRPATIIAMNANLSTSHPDLNPPTRVKINDTATTLATTLLKESTPMSDEATRFQPSTSTQRPQVTYLAASTATLHQQNEVIRLVLPGISHTRKGVVAA
jgi:hypothetical protein